MGPMPALDAAPVPTTVVQAWHDEVVPAAGVIACHCGANPDAPLAAALCGMCCMGISGELAHEQLGDGAGTGSYRIALHDAMSRLDEALLRQRCRVRRLA